MAHRLPLALAVIAVASTLGSQTAVARVRAGADISSTLPLGTTERFADPVMTGRVKLQWMFPYEHLVIGLVGGQARQPHRANGDPTLTGTLIGAEVAWMFGPKEWGTRPYISLQTGLAQLALSGGATFDPPSRKTSASGWFLIPEAGLAVELTKNFGLRFDFRYEYIRSASEMLISDVKTYDAQSLGVGGGVILTF